MRGWIRTRVLSECPKPAWNNLSMTSVFNANSCLAGFHETYSAITTQRISGVSCQLKVNLLHGAAPIAVQID